VLSALLLVGSSGLFLRSLAVEKSN
jgi:hypothetical protein